MTIKLQQQSIYQIREFNNIEIRQHKVTQNLDGTALLKVYNNSTRFADEALLGIESKEKCMEDFFRGKERLELILAIASETQLEKFQQTKSKYGNFHALDVRSTANIKKLAKDLGLIVATHGNGAATFFNPYLFVAFANWLSPVCHARTIKWLTDNLITLRSNTASLYIPMTTALTACCNDIKFAKLKQYPIADYIKAMNEELFGIHVSGMRNYLCPKQLDYLHNAESVVIKACEKGKVKCKEDMIDVLELISNIEKYQLNDNQKIMMGLPLI